MFTAKKREIIVPLLIITYGVIYIGVQQTIYVLFGTRFPNLSTRCTK